MISPDEFLAEAERLQALAPGVQDESQPHETRVEMLKNLSDRYHKWYRDALLFFDSKNRVDARQCFEREYEGSIFAQKILTFLTEGLKISPLFDPAKPSPLISKWLYGVSDAFNKPIIRQCNYIVGAGSHPQSTTVTSTPGWNPTIRRILDAFLDKADTAKTNNEKKFAYEYIALFLIGAVEGLQVIGQDERGSAEEIDLWVANKSLDPFFSEASRGSVHSRMQEPRRGGERQGAP